MKWKSVSGASLQSHRSVSIILHLNRSLLSELHPYFNRVYRTLGNRGISLSVGITAKDELTFIDRLKILREAAVLLLQGRAFQSEHVKYTNAFLPFLV